MMGVIRKFVLAAVASLALLGCTEEGDLAVGDALPSLTWEGYVNEEAEGLSTSQPFVDYGIDQLAASGRRYALLHTAEAF